MDGLNSNVEIVVETGDSAEFRDFFRRFLGRALSRRLRFFLVENLEVQVVCALSQVRRHGLRERVMPERRVRSCRELLLDSFANGGGPFRDDVVRVDVGQETGDEIRKMHGCFLGPRP